jgi:hypothetical protein
MPADGAAAASKNQDFDVLPPAAALAMKLHHFPPRVLRLSAVPAGAIGTVPLSAACDHVAKYESCGYTKIIRPRDS